MNAESVDVLIAGGGIAGLATSFELHRRGVSCVVVEQAPRAGGVILSEEIDGYTIDAGPDSLLVQKPQGIELCEQLGLGDRLVPTKPPRLAFIQRNGRLHALPANSVLGVPTRLGPFIKTGLFTWAGKLRMGAEWLVPPRRDPGDESIGAFMRRRFGAEAATYLAEPLLAGIHAGDVDRLSVRALFPRFVEEERVNGAEKGGRHRGDHNKEDRGAPRIPEVGIRGELCEVTTIAWLSRLFVNGVHRFFFVHRRCSFGSELLVRCRNK